MRFELWETVKLKDDLIIGEVYYQEKSTIGDKLTYKMYENMEGKESQIIEIKDGGYILDESPIHTFYDGMLEYPRDDFAEEPYLFNAEVEIVIAEMSKQYYLGLIDKALDDKLHETNPDEFQKLITLSKQ